MSIEHGDCNACKMVAWVKAELGVELVPWQEGHLHELFAAWALGKLHR